MNPSASVTGVASPIAGPRAERLINGLSTLEADARLAQYGQNRLPQPKPPSPLIIFFQQFKSPLIYILLLAAGVSLLFSEAEDAVFIMVVLILNGVIGTVQEYSAGRASAALRKLEQPHATVIRDSRVQQIDASHVVPEDVVLLEAGERVPADMALLQTTDMLCDESMLTGESLPAQKTASVEGEPTDACNSAKAFAGTLVTRGRGKGCVTATGLSTEMGRIAAEIGKASFSQPPLMIRLAHFSNVIAWVVGITTLLLIGVGLMRGMDWNDLFLMSVGLAVSAIPEGLPIAISVALAISMRRMAKRHVIVRRMTAVESLGSCTMIATDKTGTLTLNELTVTDIRLPDGTELALDASADLDACEVRASGLTPDEARASAVRLLTAASLPNEGSLILEDGVWKGLGDTVDVALLAAAHKIGLSHEDLKADYPLVDRIPYEPDLRYAASFHRANDRVRIFVKGSAETLAAMSDRMAAGGQTVPIDRALLLAQKEAMAADGLRVLAFAEGEIGSDTDRALDHRLLVDLVFVGLAGMKDPLRPEVIPAIRDCRTAGVEVAMLTGDDPRTAAAIAAQAGIVFRSDEVTSGDVVQAAEAAGQDQLDRLTKNVRVYARVAPAQKLAIVMSMARNGHYVAVTGDGINDAPALKHAHVGVAMGLKGTEVAKESADIVVTDDNFASILSGISEGRTAYANIRKVILMLVATGAAEMVLFLFAFPLGLPMPLLPVQLLWLNLATNGLQDVALAGEKPEGDELRHPPRRPKEPIFDGLMIRRIILSTLVIGAGGFAVFYWLLSQGYEVAQARNLLLLLFVMFENLQTITSRSEHRSVFDLPFFGNPLLLATVVLAQALHIAAMYIPWLRDTLELQPVSLTEWALLLIAGLSILVVTELDCPSSNDLRLFLLLKIGVSGSVWGLI
ncbi:cation-translocating P-type ATPase, partial [Brucella tritici]|uniref:cation-translocating P-type ATPase n=1 Tax=Brucella tritici TaxID=94626 RepID=UPI00158FDB59